MKCFLTNLVTMNQKSAIGFEKVLVLLNFLGTVQNLLYDMASGEGNILEKNLLALHEIIAEKLTAPSPFP